MNFENRFETCLVLYIFFVIIGRKFEYKIRESVLGGGPLMTTKKKEEAICRRAPVEEGNYI